MSTPRLDDPARANSDTGEVVVHWPEPSPLHAWWTEVMFGSDAEGATRRAHTGGR